MWLLRAFRRVLLSAEPAGAHEVSGQSRAGLTSPPARASAPQAPLRRVSSSVWLRGGRRGPSFPVGSAWFSREGASWRQDSAGPGREGVPLTCPSVSAAVPAPAEVVRASGPRPRPPRARSPALGVTSLLAPRLGLAQSRGADEAGLARPSSSAGGSVFPR